MLITKVSYRNDLSTKVDITAIVLLLLINILKSSKLICSRSVLKWLASVLNFKTTVTLRASHNQFA